MSSWQARGSETLIPSEIVTSCAPSEAAAMKPRKRWADMTTSSDSGGGVLHCGFCLVYWLIRFATCSDLDPGAVGHQAAGCTQRGFETSDHEAQVRRMPAKAKAARCEPGCWKLVICSNKGAWLCVPLHTSSSSAGSFPTLTSGKNPPEFWHPG